MEIVCIITSGVVAVAALAVLWRKTPKTDPELVRAMSQTAISAYDAGLASVIKEAKAKIEIAEMDIHKVFDVPVTQPQSDRVDGEVSVDDGKPEDSP